MWPTVHASRTIAKHGTNQHNTTQHNTARRWEGGGGARDGLLRLRLADALGDSQDPAGRSGGRHSMLDLAAPNGPHR